MKELNRIDCPSRHGKYGNEVKSSHSKSKGIKDEKVDE